jgi:hypothetical protein
MGEGLRPSPPQALISQGTEKANAAKAKAAELEAELAGLRVVSTRVRFYNLAKNATPACFSLPRSML